jgi:HK97 family phage prohead protease
MPYYISDTAEGCEGWATVKDDGEVMGCHTTKQDAIDQALAIALAEDSTFEGERSEVRELPDNYRPATSDDVPEGRACGNCIFFNEDRLDDEGRAWCERWEAFAEGGAYCNAWEPREEARQVDLSPPAYMRASARRGLQWHEDGLSGDGLQPQTVREARAMADGSVTSDKWVRIRAFLARHMVDFDAPAASPSHPNFPSPGVVAIALWGGGTSRRSAQRAMDYADGVIGRIEAENEGRAKGEALSKMETRTNPAQFEVRETEEGMTFSGYAAVFNSDSLPLPFTERIAPGAFRGSLRNRNDIKLLWNHDSGQPLASTRAGNLRLTEDERGLYVEATLADTTVGRDARELISKGIVDSMSFGFTVARNGEEWSDDGQVRTLTKISLHEVSIVSFPAYPGTAGSTAVRGLDKVAKRAEVDPDELADALLKIENGEDITSADRNIISTVLDKLSPVEEEPEKPRGDLDMLALKKKKLDLLMGL